MNESIILKKGEGRTYACGTMTAIFKADEEETKEKYSISEWWLDPKSTGPGAHLHEENDEVFYVIAGNPSVLVGSVGRYTGRRFFTNTGEDYARLRK